MNNVFVHPELRSDTDLNDPVLKEVNQLVQDFLNERRGRKVAVQCHFINNATGVAPANAKPMEDVLGRFEHDKQHRNFKVQVYGIREIFELAVDGKIRVEKEYLEFIIDGREAYRFEDNSSKPSLGLPKKVFIGICNVNEFIRLQNKYHRNQLYSENIRLYLGDRAAVNKDIISTITHDESIWFPYMNNGISVICDDLTMSAQNASKKTVTLEIKNMQVINGCQTVNALYSAKFGEQTKDNFRASNVLVKIYQIEPGQRDFKMSVIKATNNQNAVKTFSLLANDPVQIKIQEILKQFGYLYDRKGEARQDKSEKVVGMPNAALAYRAVYWFAAQSLRSRIGQSRVFQTTEYEKIYSGQLLEEPENLNKLSVELLVASLLLDEVREQIAKKSDRLVATLPIIKKSAYYLAGFIYAKHKDFFSGETEKMATLLLEENRHKLRNSSAPSSVIEKVRSCFDQEAEAFRLFYNSVSLDKTDIDNLLKSKDFGKAYKKKIETITGEDIDND
ncbi:MAG: hypothetical protein EPO28_18635 [Saprospiraceae bacterium]|nr:MAG: hypothetical protein EPO28_18635 [Saprospiraceae bacterium]